MRLIETESLLRIAGLLVWLLVCAEYLAVTPTPQEGTPLAPFLAEQLVVLALLLAFAVSFWLNMREIPAGRESHRTYFLLSLQMLPALIISEELAYIVALESALVLPHRSALRWIAGQNVVLLGWLILSAHLGLFKLAPLAPTTSSDVTLGLAILSILAWQMFAFFAGWFAAREAESRREVAGLHAELVLAQQALAEKSRGEERLHISRELHDSVGHHLVALGLQLDLAQRVLEPARAAHIATAADVSRQMLAEVRQVVATLREEQAIDLRRELEALQAAVPQPEIHLSLLDPLPELDPPVSKVVLRCVQEAVSNTLHHAHARNLWIALDRVEDTLLLGIRDDGRGAPTFTLGNGLTGMRERVESISGSLEASSNSGQGFTLKIRIPITGRRA